MFSKTRVLLSLLLLMGCAVVQAQSDPLLEQADKLMTQERHAEALSLLEESMETHAGDPQYDYLLGRAALANNKPNLAVFALERVVMTKPTAPAPRLTLARAYIALKEYDQAKNEVMSLQRQKHNAKIMRVSNQYLQHIENAKRRKNMHYGLQLTMGFGHDTNANSATAINQFLGVDLSDNSQETASNTGNIIISGKADVPIARKLRSETMLHLFQYEYSDASFVNTRGVAIQTGLNYKTNKNRSEQIQLQAVHVDVDEKLNSRQANVQLSHKQSLKNGNFNLSAKAGQTRYADNYSSRDVQQLSAGMQYHLNISKKLLSSFSVLFGEDDPIESDSNYGRRFNAAQAGLIWSLGKTYTMASISYMQSKYDSPFFNLDRNDNNIGATIKLNYKLNSKWMVGPSLKFARNQSSVDLYDYDRKQAMLFISHQII